MIRTFDKYSYPGISRDETTGKRLYRTPDDFLVPSVTTVLSKTKDMTHLLEWQKRVGKENANKIRNQAASVGTSMHLFLECYVEEKERKCDFSPTHAKAKKMADVIINKGLSRVSEVWGSEVQLYYEDQYAGTTDLIGMYDDKPCIMDFKQTNKPKKKEWVEDYYLQLAAYINAHNSITGSKIENGVIFMCSQALEFQKFELNEIHFQKYSYMWFKRLEKYNKMAEAGDLI